MDPQAVQLGAEDYQALLGMLTSPDPSARTEGQSLAKKLTPDEQQAFFSFQQQKTKGVDPSASPDRDVVGGIPYIGGISPEAAVSGIAGVARGVAGAGTGLAAKTAAAIKAAAGEAAPNVKYELAHQTLKFAGVPEVIAMPLAMAISGYKRGAKGAATEVGEVAPTAAAEAPAKVETPLELTRRLKAENQAKYAATSPAETVSGGTPPPADLPPAAGPAGSPAISPQQLLNEEALAARRAAYQAKQAAPPTEAAPTPKMTAVESKFYLQLRVQGKTDAQARDAILASRVLNERLGLKTPTTAETKFPKGMRGRSAPRDEP